MLIFSCPAHLPVARAAIERFCRLLGFGEPCVGNVALAVDEALANIIKHAYDGRPDGTIDITLIPLVSHGRPGGLEVVLEDHGRVVEPGQIRGRDLNDVRPGGLGVHIMNSCMDRIEYTHPPEGGTRLRMVKALPDETPAPGPSQPRGEQHGNP